MTLIIENDTESIRLFTWQLQALVYLRKINHANKNARRNQTQRHYCAIYD